MKLDETKCDKCFRCDKTKKIHNDDSDNENSIIAEKSSINNLNGENDKCQQLESNRQDVGEVESIPLAIAKCIDCDENLCTNCLLQHQLENENMGHKFIANMMESDRVNQSVLFLNEIYRTDNDSNNVNSIESQTKVNDVNKSARTVLDSSTIVSSAFDNESSPTIEKIRNCHMTFLGEEFSKVVDDLCQDNIIKRRHSNLDNVEFESKLASTSINIIDQSKLEEEVKMDNSVEEKASNELTIGAVGDLFLNDFSSNKFQINNQLRCSEKLSIQQSKQQQANNQQHYMLKLKQHQNQLQQMQQQQNQQNAASQTNNRLSHIETEITKTFNFYVQILKERKEYLIKELNTIVQFALLNHTQSINKQVQVQYQLELKKQQVEKELNDYYELLNHSSTSINTANLEESNLQNKMNLLKELNNLTMVNNQLISQLKSTNPMMSIEFISNYSAIQTSIRNTFGFIRINQQQHQNTQNQLHSNQQQAGQITNSSLNNLLYATKQPHHQSYQENLSNNTNHELSILCDLKGINNSQTNAQYNILSNNSSITTLSTLSSNSSSVSNELVTSPISINKKHSASNLLNLQTSNNSGQQFSAPESLHPWKSSSNQLLSGTDVIYGSNSISSQHQNMELLEMNSDEDILKDNQTTSVNGATNYQQQNSSTQNIQSGLRENPLITLSAGSTSSNKSNKSSSSSLASSASSSNSGSKSSPTYTYGYDQSTNNSVAIQTQHQQHNTSHHSRSSSHHNHHQHLIAASQVGSSSALSTNKLCSIYDLSLKNTIQLTRSKMIYHCKFGEFGINDGQFTEPSGVTINTNNDIIVADTNSHRIQIFDREGNFKFKFGECGKRDGQLLYPNRVSIVKQTGDIVVTERSPTHQIQIYNKYGQFLRKFGATILQHPRGVCVDYKGRIVVVECKVMRVIIFDLYGNVLNKFNCSKYLEFPNGVCCSNPTHSNNYREEIYISDNRAHCIKVFDYNGNFLRQIGGEGITNYPIGVGINSNNEILVADNHNNFNLTVFSQDGKLVNALESKVKHAQCFDVGLMDDGSIVLASKDYRIYVYKYSSNLDNSFMLSASPTLASNTVSSSSSIVNASSNFPLTNSHPMLNQSASHKYDLFADNNNNATMNNANVGLYNYFKSTSINDSILQNCTSNSSSNGFTNFFSDFNSSNGCENSGQKSSLFLGNNNQESHFQCKSLSSNINDISHNESNSLHNLSANTTTTNNIDSILNGIL